MALLIDVEHDHTPTQNPAMGSRVPNVAPKAQKYSFGLMRIGQVGIKNANNTNNTSNQECGANVAAKNLDQMKKGRGGRRTKYLRVVR
ncbi:hypothetical protein N7530_001782 [Penicillium desertorum]|uniref:Uncharacterized protein n=1 Tax=Penicillium desertorum TaxID=1303715 RepID=A0A9W9XAS2_9EURO|nr:hypothetical protein N7530_001782 [Penicillium desertorum]